MILTGTEITMEIRHGNITFTPFDEANVNPNSINYRLGPKLKVYRRADRGMGALLFECIDLAQEGCVLYPGQLYLGHTYETIGSQLFAMSLIGRSSIGRLGLFVQVSANLGHTASCHQWTLELVASVPVRVYPRMRLGQVSFWTNAGDIDPYRGWYGRRNNPEESRLNSLLEATPLS